MSEVLEKIRSRGYWKVIIRPATFVERRVANQRDLLPIIEKNSVNLKGWSFPHVDSYADMEKGPDWIGQEIGRDPILELWRFYQSGQFIHYFGIPEDWHSGTNQWLPSEDGVHRVILGVSAIVLQLTEIYEFAARLCFTEASDNEICLEITFDNLEDHFLLLPEIGSPRVSWFPRASRPSVQYFIHLTRTELVADAKELSLAPALELFASFRWDPNISLIRELQSEIIRRVPLMAEWR